MEKYTIGLDNGGTMIKAAVFDSKGNEVAVASGSTEIITPKPGYTERDMDILWDKNCDCVRRVIEKASIKPEQVIGLAVCGHGKGLYLWGKENKPIYNGIVSTDNRAWEYPQKWEENGTFEKMYPRLCQKVLACQQLSLLAWMKDHEPQVYQQIEWVFSVKDYIRFRLTGKAYSEATDISGSGLLNVRDVRFDQEMLDAFGIGEIFGSLAPLCYSSDHCGTVTRETAEKTGLREGTPVAGGMFDIDSCAIGMAITQPEQLCTITGTWTINEFISPVPITGTEIAMNSLYAIPGFYLIEECSATSAGNLEWVIENCLTDFKPPQGENLYDYINREVDGIDPADNQVVYLPFLYGSNAHVLAKASFIGLTSYHSRSHMLQAVFEGVAYSAKTHIDRLLKNRDMPAVIRMGGGAANSKVWVQMFADVLGIPIETVSGVKELGALGCAMAAFVAAGVYEDYNQAAEAMVRVNPAVMPSAQRHKVYAEKYETYTRINQALDTVWERFKV